MSAWAKPGVKCVCVDDVPSDWRRVFVVKGQTYTVAGMDGVGGVHLIERPADGSYWAWRFRPLITRTQEQDLAIFRPLLDRLPIREDAL